MNSWSKNNYESCKKEERYEHCRKEEKREENQCPTIIKCGCPSSTPIPVIAALGTTQLTLASLTLDTSCLCEPTIKLDFTSNLVAGVAFVGTMSIRVFKQCRNQFNKVPIGPSWQVGSLVALSSDTFSFFICDSDSCNDDCCTYTVEATINSTAALAIGVSFNNATLSAIATCGANKCERCNQKEDNRY